MNKELWNKILAFDFDDSTSGKYGFITRLSNENYWTRDFTELAILEYKKFMYLISVSDTMLSPSKIVDVVWHQHLIFTKSYAKFCLLLGKQVEHIPSTHHQEEKEIFKLAKEKTRELYTNTFGEQPPLIWNYTSMYNSLHLETSKIKIDSLEVYGILAFIILLTPAYFLLNPIYSQINNPYFICGFIVLCIFTFIILEFYNQKVLKSTIKLSDKNSFIYNLQPSEVIYLKTQDLKSVIDVILYKLVKNNVIVINSNKQIELIDFEYTNSEEEEAILNLLDEFDKMYYNDVVRQLIIHPIFMTTKKSLDRLQNYLNQSKVISKLFFINFCIWGLLLMSSTIRLISGIIGDKPIILILITTIVLFMVIIYNLKSLINGAFTKSICDLYEKEIIPNHRVKNNIQWNYLMEFSTLSLILYHIDRDFLEKYNYKITTNSTDSSSCSSNDSSNDSSSSDSSCSSGCGGCGS